MPSLKPKKLTPGVLITSCIIVMLSFTAQSQIPKLNSHSPSPATVYLDFDGHTVKGTAWNWDGVIRAKPSGLSSALITEVFHRIAEDFRIFNLNITTDSNVFKKASIAKRMRVIFTPTSSWYGNVAGVSFVNSFTWGDDTPAWVFSELVERNPKYMAEAASHEIGHTLGLQHQSTYDKNCKLIAEYSQGKGSGEIGWAPIMGVGYYRNFSLWSIGQSSEGCDITQNDITTISKGLNNIGLRKDEHGNTRQTATALIFNGQNFNLTGIINSSADRDYFRVPVGRRSRLTTNIIPANVGRNNAGANVDLYLTLVTSSGDTIGQYNPKTLLGASLDTILNPGTYYLIADGTSNQYVSDYGSVGLYTLSGLVENPARQSVLVRGDKRNNQNIISWSIETGTVPRVTYLEYSLDRNTYTSIPVATSSYVHKSPGREVSYRVKVITTDETVAYSDTIMLGNAAANVSLVTNFVNTSIVQVRSDGDYAYQLLDQTGRLLGRGRLTAGINKVAVSAFQRGVLILKVFSKHEQLHLRFMKQ